MDTKTKTQKAKKTPKQAVARINSLLKGIDNSVVAINKQKAVLSDAVKEVRSLMGGLSNIQTVPAKKLEAKVKAAVKPAKPAKVVKAAPAKKALPVKAASAKKLEVKAASAKKALPVKPGKAIEGRPSLKEVVKQVIITGPLTAADIWKQATSKWGYWSRQSLYNVLKDEKVFARQGEKFALVNSMVDDAEAEKFVKQVESNQAVSSVQ